MSPRLTIKERLIIGVDPGLTTGIAWLHADKFEAAELSPLDTCDFVLTQLKNDLPTIVSAERFTFQASSAKKTRQYDALEIIGTLRWLCHRYRATFITPGASEAQRIGSPQVLRALGWWQRGKDHSNKAGAQVAYAFAQTHPDEFESLLPPGMF